MFFKSLWHVNSDIFAISPEPKGTGRMGKLLPLFGNLWYFTSKIIRAKDLIVRSAMGFHLRKEIGMVPPDQEQAISWSFLGLQEALLTSGAYPAHTKHSDQWLDHVSNAIADLYKFCKNFYNFWRFWNLLAARNPFNLRLALISQGIIYTQEFFQNRKLKN